MSSDERTQSAAGPAFDPHPVPPPGWTPPRSSRLRWLIVILIVLVLGAGVLTTLLVRGNSDRTASQPATSGIRSTAAASPSATANPSGSASGSGSGSAGSAVPTNSPSQPSATPALLPHGAEAPGSSIPWAQVDDGWNLRAWNNEPNPGQMPLARWTIYLVNPVGGRYRIATLAPNTFPAAWSPDRRRAVMHSYLGERDTLREYDLSTGRQLASFVRGNRDLLGYAGPGGHSLLLRNPDAGDQVPRLELVSTSGRYQRTLPSGTATLGQFATVLYRPDGSSFLAAAQHGFAVVGHDGRLIRQIGLPPAAQLCEVRYWWSAQVAAGSCHYLTPGNGSGVDNLVLIPVDGRAVSLITHSTSPFHTFIGAWRYSGGIFAALASGSCGISDLATIDAAGNSHPYRYRLPAGVSSHVRVAGVHADRATLVTGSCGSESSSLVSLDLRSGATTVLLGPGLNGGSVW